MLIVEKAAIEEFPIGLRYSEPDLDSGETIVQASSTATVTPTGVGGLTATGLTVVGSLVSTFIKGGVAGVEYRVLFKVKTSTGKIFSNPNKDAIVVTVI